MSQTGNLKGNSKTHNIKTKIKQTLKHNLPNWWVTVKEVMGAPMLESETRENDKSMI